jgi:hypothetical protein
MRQSIAEAARSVQPTILQPGDKDTSLKPPNPQGLFEWPCDISAHSGSLFLEHLFEGPPQIAEDLSFALLLELLRV